MGNKIEYFKGNSIPHVDALSRLQFYKSSNEKTDKIFEDTFLHWVEADMLLLENGCGIYTRLSIK